MELEDLNDKERLALAGLVRAVVLADRVASEEEAERVEDVVLAIGEEAYQKAMDEAESRFADEDGLRGFLRTIERQEAREVIYGTVLDIAMVDGGIQGESELLGWLAETWQVESELQEPLPA